MYIDEVAEICDLISVYVGMRGVQSCLVPKNTALGLGLLVWHMNVAHLKSEKLMANRNPESMKQTNVELTTSVSWK